jgi:hypothetical protein
MYRCCRRMRLAYLIELFLISDRPILCLNIQSTLFYNIISFPNNSLHKTNSNITLDSRSKVYLDIQIKLNLDLQARISIWLFLAVLCCSCSRVVAWTQCVAWVGVERVATRGQWLLCDIGCVLGAVVQRSVSCCGVVRWVGG